MVLIFKEVTELVKEMHMTKLEYTILSTKTDGCGQGSAITQGRMINFAWWTLPHLDESRLYDTTSHILARLLLQGSCWLVLSSSAGFGSHLESLLIFLKPILS